MFNPTVSVILPAYNAERRLRFLTNQWLEILAELTPNFDVFIVDDGSIDETLSVARELARWFPQVRFAHHALRHGQMVAVQTGLQQTEGEIILVHEDLERLSAQQVQQLWELRHDPQLVMVHPATSHDRQMLRFDLSGASPRGGTAPEAISRSGGIRMLRRTAIAKLEDSDNHPLPMRVERLMRADPAPGSKLRGHLPHLLVRFQERQEAVSDSLTFL